MRGGKRAGAGRPLGAKSRATKEAKATLEELARSYTDRALNTLISVAEKSESDSARVAAATALLDRGYGRPHQSQTVTMTAGDAFVQMLKVVNERRAQNGPVANGVDQPSERPAEVRH